MSERILIAMTVYNGREFVPAALRSAKRLEAEGVEIDILALDDASPDLEWSFELAELCAAEGIGYYRTPRNLGITRNVSLGLLHGERAGYDHVVICNSDVLFPKDLVTQLLEVWRSDPTIGSVTAWSNNVSIYSLPNDDPDAHLHDQDVVDWLSASLSGDYRGVAIDVPAGVSFCTLFPTEVIRSVGLMDPVFGRGYCEETDWTLRSKAFGHRIVLAPSAFVFHRGRGSTVEAGLLGAGETTVIANEMIIDHRYPLFRSQVQAFVDGGVLDALHASALDRILRDAAAQFGYRVEVAWLAGRTEGDGVVVTIEPADTQPRAVARFRGFTGALPIPLGATAEQAAVAICEHFGGASPTSVAQAEGGPTAAALATAFGLGPQAHRPSYPSKV